MRSDVKEILFGSATMAVLVLVLALSYGGHALKADTGAGFKVTATFNRIDGLSEGAVVRMGGIQIGKVVATRLDEHYRAVLTLALDPGVGLPTDTSAAIHTDGLFGEKFLVLEPGGSLDNLKDGDQITFTQDAVIISELLDLIIAQGKAARGGKN